MITQVGPSLPSERVELSTGGSQVAKVLFVGASALCLVYGLASVRALVAQAQAAEARPGGGGR